MRRRVRARCANRAEERRKGRCNGLAAGVHSLRHRARRPEKECGQAYFGGMRRFGVV